MSNEVGADMGWRFRSRHWSRAGGNLQSLRFYHEMLERVRHLLPKDGFEWHDYGCAEGDGVAYLAAVVPRARCRGFDISPDAVGRALDRWYGVEFEVGDVKEPGYQSNIISTLHTLEHIDDPIGALHKLKDHADLVIAVTPPVTEEEHGGHTGMRSDEYNRLIEEEFDPVLHDEYRLIRLNPWTGGYISEGNYLWVL